MSAETSIKLTLEQRKLILQLMNYSYTIPEEYHECVTEAIKKYATKQYSDETIKKMVQKSQSVANSGFLLREDSMALFRGKFAEWLACIEYNALKNSGSVIMTIVNPDETSKADLLHFIKVGDTFKAVAGPDIKSGGSTYVFNQWKKIVTSRHDIPMVDFDDILTTEDGLKQLTKGQRKEFDELCEKFPRKRPIPSRWSNQDELRIRTDYFKSILEIEGNFQYSPEISNLLKLALSSQENGNLPQSDWTQFNIKCKEIFKDFSEICDKNFAEAKIYEENIDNAKGVNSKTTLAVKLKKVPWRKIGKGLVIVSSAAIGIVAVGKKYSSKKSINTKKVITTVGKSIVKAAAIVTPLVTPVEKPQVEVPKVSLGGTHASPIRHAVRAYVKKDGTKVRSHMKGGKK